MMSLRFFWKNKLFFADWIFMHTFVHHTNPVIDGTIYGHTQEII